MRSAQGDRVDKAGVVPRARKMRPAQRGRKAGVIPRGSLEREQCDQLNEVGKARAETGGRKMRQSQGESGSKSGGQADLVEIWTCQWSGEPVEVVDLVERRTWCERWAW